MTHQSVRDGACTSACRIVGRSAGWGTVIGLVAAAMVGAVVAVVLGGGPPPAMIVGGGLYGLIFGSPIGLVVGLLNAPVMILVASRWPTPRAARIVAATTTAAIAMSAVAAVGGNIVGVGVGALVCAGLAACVAPRVAFGKRAGTADSTPT